MLRFGLTLFLCCAALHAQAAGNDLGACLDPSTTLLAGGEVSDKELAAGQSACAHLKQTTQDDKLLLRITAASSRLLRKRSAGASIKPSGGDQSVAPSHRPGAEPVGPLDLVRRPMRHAPAARQPRPQHQFDAPAKRRIVGMPLARDDNRPRLPRMFLEPFRPRPAHVMQLGPVAVGKVPHDACPFAGPMASHCLDRGSRQAGCQRV